jgi:hypothetical protein
MAPFSFTRIEHARDGSVDQRKNFTSPSAFFDAMLARGFPVGSKDGPAIIGSLFAEKRTIDSIEAVTALILDFDGKTGKKDPEGKDIYESLNPDEFIAALPFEGFAYASYNHTPEFPRWRAIYPFETPLTVSEFARLWQWANEKTRGKMDGQCKDPGHLFYLPRISAASAEKKFHWMRKIEGPPLSMAAVPTDFVYNPAETHKDIIDVPDLNRPASPAMVQPLLEALQGLPLFRYAVSHPSELTRIAWRAVCTALVYAAEDLDEESHTAACRLFHEISRADKKRYRAQIAQKEWVSNTKKIRERTLNGPVSYKYLRDNDTTPAQYLQPVFPDSKNLLVDARRILRGDVSSEITEVSEKPVSAPPPSRRPAPVSVLPTTPTDGAPKPAKSTPTPPAAAGATTGAPPAKAPQKPAGAVKSISKLLPRNPAAGDDDDEEYNYGTLTGRESEFLRDRSTRGRVWLQRSTDGFYGSPMTDDGFTHFLIHKGPMSAKAAASFKGLCRGFSERAPIFDSKEPIVELNGVTYLNTYRPSDLVPVQGNWDDLKLMFFFNAASDPRGFDYYMDWLAAPLQSLYFHGKPLKLGTTIVFKGDQGTGKGLMQFAIELMYGRHNCCKLGQDDLETQFNSLIDGKLFVTCNEVMSSTNRTKQTANKMKEWITEHEVRLERKGQDTALPSAYFNMIYTSNDEQPVYIEPADRRHTVFETRGVLAQECYDRVAADLGTPITPGPRKQLAAMFYELLHRPISANVRKFYQTAAREALIATHIDSDTLFFTEIETLGFLSVGEDWRAKTSANDPRVLELEGHPGVIPASALRAVYIEFCKQHGHRGARKYNTMLKALRQKFPDATSVVVRTGVCTMRCWTGLPMKSPDTLTNLSVIEPVALPAAAAKPTLVAVDTSLIPANRAVAPAPAPAPEPAPEPTPAAAPPALPPNVVVATEAPTSEAPPGTPTLAPMSLARYGVPETIQEDVEDEEDDPSDQIDFDE